MEAGDENQTAVGRAVDEASGKKAPKQSKKDVSGRDVVVLASGNLGLIYLMDETRRLTLEEIESRHPLLLANLRDHEHLGWLMVQSSDGPLVLGPSGTRRLETGLVEVVRYTTVDDCGRAVNPMILHGQTHGGIAQGVGQALWEACAYDETGQLLSSTLMEYALPRADMLPAFTTEISEVPSTSHPLGLRGGGEGGTTPALGAVVNAIVDALAELGVEHVEMPATSERVWQAIRDAQRMR